MSTVGALTAALLVLGCSAAPPPHNERVLPLTKVLGMLHDMQKSLQDELKSDEEAYEHLKCWCDKNKKQKEEAVSEAGRRIDDLQSQVEGSAASKSSLEVNLKDLKIDIAEDETSLKEATAMREEEAAKFHEFETELIVGLKQLHGAITALEKHHPAMLQEDLSADPAVRRLLPGLRKMVHQHVSILGWLGPKEKDVLTSFMRAQPDIFEADVSFLQLGASLPFVSYAPQSGQVFGILKQMEESFKTNLAEAQEEEASKVKAFAEMKGAKLAEIAEQKQTVETKKVDLADAKVELTTSKKDQKDTHASQSADMKFQIEMTEKCTKSDAEWERRRKLRMDEITAVSEAISILTSDEIRDAQSTTFGFLQTSKIQTSASRERLIRQDAARIVLGAVKEASSLRLLLAAIGNDPFAKVNAAIDALVAKLKIEQADEVKHRDLCVGNLNENERDTAQKAHEQSTLEAKIEDLTAKSEALAKHIELLKAEIQDLKVQLQRASLDRQMENHEFQRTVADQRLTRTVLEKAHSKLAAFYNKRHSFLQREDPADPKPMPWERAAPPGLRSVKKNSQAGGVISLIMDLIGEAKVLEDTATSDEQNAQEAYAELISTTNADIKTKGRAIVDDTEEKASVDGDKTLAEQDHASVVEDLNALAATLADLHSQCDFLLHNFDARQNARAAEIEGLGQVKAVLAGASFSG